MYKFVGIDIGNYAVKVIIAQRNKKKHGLSIIGSGAHHSRGILKGSIIDKYQTSKSIQRAVEDAEKSSETSIESSYVSVGGIHINSIVKSNEILVSNKKRVTDLDIDRIKENIIESIALEYPNHTIIHDTPISYNLDDIEMNTDPVGLIVKNKLKITYFVVVCFNQHLKRIEESIEDVGITIEGFLPGPIASSYITLTEEQRETGCVLVDIGAQTVSILVYDEGVPISLKVFPIGSTNITNSIAVNLKISTGEAEKMKIGLQKHNNQKEIQKVVETRLKEIFKLVAGHLEEIDKSYLLPGGVVISGGAAGLTSIKEISTSILKLPTQIINPNTNHPQKIRIPVHNSAWSSAYGLTYFAMLQNKLNESKMEILLKKTINLLRKIILHIRKKLS